MSDDLKTWAHFAIFERGEDADAYGVGCELINGQTGDVYHFFSLYLPKSEYPNKRQAIRATIPEILAVVPDEHTSVEFWSTAVQFMQKYELTRRHSIYVPGKTLEFRQVRHIRDSANALAIDAVIREESISERL